MARIYGSHTWNGTINAVFPDRDKDSDPVEWEVSVEMDCTFPGDPGQITGPPENCYQAEGPEFEWSEVTVFVGGHTFMKTKDPKALVALLGDTVSDHVLDEAMTDACENWEPEEPEER